MRVADTDIVTQNGGKNEEPVKNIAEEGSDVEEEEGAPTGEATGQFGSKFTYGAIVF